jgi:hypothetical protein
MKDNPIKMCQKLLSLYFLASSMIFSISGCGNGEAKRKLDLREKELAQKEDSLLKLARELKFKEQQILKTGQLLDSLKSQNDTLGVYNPKLIGTWLVTMQCTETTCEGYAVGDTKTEHWNISYQKNKVIVKAISNKKVIRTYLGLFKENSLKLIAAPPPDADTEMNVMLSPHSKNENLMEGQRIIDRANNCRVVFSLKVEKQ